MTRTGLTMLAFIVLAVAAVGCDNTAVRQSELKLLVMEYHIYWQDHDRGPADADAWLEDGVADPALIEKVRAGQYEVAWDGDLGTDGTPGYLLVWEADAPREGGLVAMADSSIRDVTPEHFASLEPLPAVSAPSDGAGTSGP